MNITHEQWQAWRTRHQEVLDELAQSDIDRKRRASLQKESSYLARLVDIHDRLQAIDKQVEELAAIVSDPDMAELAELERQELAQEKGELDRQLEDILFPPDEHDNRSVFLEIRAGAGGQEAALFAADLLRMYMMYASRMGWRTSIVSESSTDLGGYREVVLHIQGRDVFGHLKHESGVHRVQRVPQTETSGRVHTSTATVAVLPEAQEVEVGIDPQDLRIDVFRSGGAGGQHVNTTDSAVRITHIPTGLVVSCQDERSQHKNKAKAMKVLRSRLVSAHKEKHDQEMSQNRKAQVGTGMRAEKVRTYNYPQNRVSDHQVNLTLKKLDMVMEGDLNELVDALREKERLERREQQLASL